MFDTIRRAFRHPILDGDGRVGEYAFPVAKSRPFRDYAPDGSYVQDFQAVYDVVKHGGAAATYNLNTVLSGPALGAVIPIGAHVFQGEVIVTKAFVGGTNAAIGVSAGHAGPTTALLGATVDASLGLGIVLPLVPTYAGAGEFTMSAEGQITVTTTGTHTAGALLIRGKYAVSPPV